MALILVWNTSVYHFKDLPILRERIRTDRPALFQWSIGASKSVEIGERVFLFKRKPAGIVASGVVVAGERQNRSGPAHNAMIEFDSFVDEPLEVSILVEELGSAWSSPASGWVCPVTDYPIVLELWGLHVKHGVGAVVAESLCNELADLGQILARTTLSE